MSAVEAPPRRWIGRPLARIEDVRFTTGTARYVDDVVLPDMLLRSVRPQPLRARAHPGGRRRGRRSGAWRSTRPHRRRSQRPDRRVRVHAARRRRGGREGDAPDPGCRPPGATSGSRWRSWSRRRVRAPPTRPSSSSSRPRSCRPCSTRRRPWAGRSSSTSRRPRTTCSFAGTGSDGDVEGAFAAADAVVRQRIRIPALDRRADRAARGGRRVRRGGRSSDDLGLGAGPAPPANAPDPPPAATAAAAARDRPGRGRRVREKGSLRPRPLRWRLCALDVRRPVKWIESRTESSLATYQGRGGDADAELALAADGRILALRARYLADLGAYLYPTTAVARPRPRPSCSPAATHPRRRRGVVGVVHDEGADRPVPRRRPARGRARTRASRRRCRGRARARSRRTPAAQRRPAEPFPYETALGFTYDSGDYEGALDAALALARLDEAARRAGRGTRRGTAARESASRCTSSASGLAGSSAP